MNWRPHTEKPRADFTTAVIAVLDDESGEPFLLNGIYTFKRGRWIDEVNSDEPMGKHITQYWWLPEDELLQTLPARIAA